ncbi:Alpha-1,6-mannosyl-glycoprotein 6-beta-N-acetylglucosaminyltransferase [Caenorhabditis elegans]|uniref:Alpha-1,6-mannosyl-glycoprotein 6-beta-N-acetylglucosaminyltransferase n=1 Tax=Caenorhabditis elegans TaxID=6239 RepID=O45704_CAEEL|nr:Alpha-1,6-mannosyl-glycoprotein 6-beta-N-acetylglucosaminyltransferase [Caenorhabditis elegans]CAB05268.4 Alpha-1,6-mannosyl-glycoprotein 6-beta-N-acetylglucosaminyltransferase [Caenorhabditis elegans]|eukprot:NP_502715.3 Uncharacterized protein CELE_R05A10.7 [Caenorhabditis elegans]
MRVRSFEAFFILLAIWLCVMFFKRSWNIRQIRYIKSNDSCMCKSNRSSISYDFCYTDPQNTSIIGKKFDCSLLDTLENLNLLGETKEVFSLSNLIQNENDLIFASATSDDHFNFSMDSFHSIRKYYPNHTYILYGLGLSEYYINSLPDNLEFRQFNTSGYPSFVNTWMHYNFKPLILAELLRENPVVWWIDSHLVTIKPNIIRNMYDDISTNRLNSNYSSIVSSVLAFHSNFAVLNTDVLGYFPTNSMELLKRQRQAGANNIFVPRTSYTMKIFKWWVLCALTDDCMSPPGSTTLCEYTSDNFNNSANCFRYDQSILNILLLNDFQDSDKFFSSNLENSFYRPL